MHVERRIEKEDTKASIREKQGNEEGLDVRNAKQVEGDQGSFGNPAFDIKGNPKEHESHDK